MSSILTLTSSTVSPPAEQNPRARERSRLPQERRFYQVNALPKLLQSPQQKPPEVATIKNIEIPTTPPTLWKRLSAPGTFSRRSSWSSTELLSVSKQNAAPTWEEKRQKVLGLSDRIKHLLSHKRSVEAHSGHLLRSPTLRPEPEPEFQPDQEQLQSLATQIAEFGSTPFRMTPMNDLAMLAVSASLPDSNHSSLSEHEIRPSTSLFNMTAGLDDPDSRPATVTTSLLIDEVLSALQPLPELPTVSDLSVQELGPTPRQSESSQPESRPTSPYDANRSEDALLDSIVDFFESFGVGFCEIGMRSPAEIEPINKTSVFRQYVAAEPA